MLRADVVGVCAIIGYVCVRIGLGACVWFLCLYARYVSVVICVGVIIWCVVCAC